MAMNTVLSPIISLVSILLLLHFAEAAVLTSNVNWNHSLAMWKSKAEEMMITQALEAKALKAAVIALGAILMATSVGIASYGIYEYLQHRKRAKAARAEFLDFESPGSESPAVEEARNPEKTTPPFIVNRDVARRMSAPMEPIPEIHSPRRSVDDLPRTMPEKSATPKVSGSASPAKEATSRRASVSQPPPPTPRPSSSAPSAPSSTTYPPPSGQLNAPPVPDEKRRQSLDTSTPAADAPKA